MNAFAQSTWKTIRADAFDTEADALDEADAKLASLDAMVTPLEWAAIEQARGVLARASKRRKEHAAKLRAAA